MKTILDQILENKISELTERHKNTTISELMKRPLFNQKRISLKEKLAKSSGVIAEMKRKSPSAGTLLTALNPAEQALKYEQEGALGISVLTDFNYFGGQLEDVTSVRNAVSLPILQKDFVLDEYQLFEAKAYGADVILLIAAALSKEKALNLSIIAKSLGLEVILEIHAPSELEYINDEVDFVMVNNRNLHLQQTDIRHSENLFPSLPKNKLKISASGIRTAQEVNHLFEIGYNGVLIGESILKESHLNLLTQKNL